MAANSPAKWSMASLALCCPCSANKSNDSRTSHANRSLRDPYPSTHSAARRSCLVVSSGSPLSFANSASFVAISALSLVSITVVSRYFVTRLMNAAAAADVCTGKRCSITAPSHSSSNHSGAVMTDSISLALIRRFASRPMAMVQRSTATSRTPSRTAIKKL